MKWKYVIQNIQKIFIALAKVQILAMDLQRELRKKWYIIPDWKLQEIGEKKSETEN